MTRRRDGSHTRAQYFQFALWAMSLPRVPSINDIALRYDLSERYAEQWRHDWVEARAADATELHHQRSEAGLEAAVDVLAPRITEAITAIETIERMNLRVSPRRFALSFIGERLSRAAIALDQQLVGDIVGDASKTH